MNPDQEVNLVPQINPEKLATRRKVFYWLTRSGRILIILTEAVVLIVFLARFGFDARIENLSEGIANKVEILEEKTNIESKALELAKATEYSKKIDEEVTFYNKSLRNINLLIPKEITLERIASYQNIAQISANTTKIDYFSKMIDNLNRNNKITSVILKQVNYIQDKNIYHFELEIEFKKQ